MVRRIYGLGMDMILSILEFPTYQVLLQRPFPFSMHAERCYDGNEYIFINHRIQKGKRLRLRDSGGRRTRR